MDLFGDCKTDARDTCLGDIPHDTPDDDVSRWLREYTVFSMVRNPFTRAASAFEYLNGSVRQAFTTRDAFDNPVCHLEWRDYCASSPRILARHCRAFPFCCETGIKKMNLNNLMVHTDPQAPCLRGEDGTWAVDFIARAEHSGDDVGALVQLINERRPAGVDEFRPEGLKRENSQFCHRRRRSLAAHGRGRGLKDYVECEAAQYLDYYTGANEECIGSIGSFYREDLEAL